MSASMMNFTKGIIAGAVIGTTVGIAVKSIKKPNTIKKSAMKAMKTMGAVMTNLNGMMK